MSDHIGRADLYLWACQPGSELTEDIIKAASYHIIAQDPEHYDADLDSFVCDNWCVALRAVLYEAWELYRYSRYYTKRGQRPTSDCYAESLSLTTAYHHGQEHVAVTMVRKIILSMFRNDVDPEKRLL